MDTQERIKTLYRKLSPQYKTRLLDDLLTEHELEGVLIEEAREEISHKRNKKPCPHCHSTHVIKRGKQNGVQVYKCNKCNKWYRETTGTPLYGIHLKEKWQSYLSLMEQNVPIKTIAKKIDICIQTSFDWRHKILSSLEILIPSKLEGLVECDELEFPMNDKGNQHLDRKPRKRASDFKRNKTKGEISVVQAVTVVERNYGRKFFKVVESKRLSKKQISKVLDDRLSENTVLITDKHSSYKSYTRGKTFLKHKTLLAKDHVDKNDKTIHLQNVNNIHSQVRNFIKPFHGVSAKYLQNYLNWYAYKGLIESSKTTLKKWFITILMSDNAYGIYELFKEKAMIIRT